MYHIHLFVSENYSHKNNFIEIISPFQVGITTSILYRDESLVDFLRENASKCISIILSSKKENLLKNSDSFLLPLLCDISKIEVPALSQIYSLVILEDQLQEKSFIGAEEIISLFESVFRIKRGSIIPL